MDGSSMCKNKRLDSKMILSKKESLHVKMIHQVTQLQMQSIDKENISFLLTKCTISYQYTIKRIHLVATALGRLWW